MEVWIYIDVNQDTISDLDSKYFGWVEGRLKAVASDKQKLINYLKGSMLHCIGEWPIVPSEIKFVIEDRTFLR